MAVGSSLHMQPCVCVCLSMLLCPVQTTEKGRGVCACVALSDRKVGDGGCI